MVLFLCPTPLLVSHPIIGILSKIKRLLAYNDFNDATLQNIQQNTFFLVVYLYYRHHLSYNPLDSWA